MLLGKRKTLKEKELAEIENWLSEEEADGRGNQARSRLIYTIRDNQFKKLVSDIVHLKFRDKNRESYELIKAKVRSLSTKIPVKIMTDFLNDCLAGGVIDTVSMINGDIKSPNIPLTNPKYEQIAREFLNLNLERLGRGEIGLAFMGIETVKEQTDLSVSEIHIEIKASRGTDFIMKGNSDSGGFGNQIKAVSTLVNALNNLGGKFKPHNKATQGGIAAIGRSNIKNLNNYFVKLGKKRTTDLLMSILKDLNKEMPEIIDRYQTDIDNAVNQDGSVDYNTLSLATAKVNFDYYKSMSKHEGILVLNLESFQFLYITDADTWAYYVDSNILQQMFAIDFRSNGLGGLSYKMNRLQQ